MGGFVGHHVLDHLLVNTDWEIIGVDSWNHKGIPERVLHSKHYQLNSERVKVVTHDLIAPFSKTTIKNIGRVDYIINIASQSHVDRSIEDPVPFIQNNINLVLHMLEFAREVKPDLFIQFSTDEVYGPAPDKYLSKEWDSHIPSNPYSGSKAAQEDIAISYWRTYGIPLIITNTMNCFGERQDPEKFIPRIIKSVLYANEVTIHGQEGNISSRFYIHCRNAADGVLHIINNLPPVKYPDANKPDRYNIVGEKELNNLELAQLVAEITGKPLKYRFVDWHNTRPGHDKRYALDGKKLRDLGWEPPIHLERALRKTIEWGLENPEWLYGSHIK